MTLPEDNKAQEMIINDKLIVIEDSINTEKDKLAIETTIVSEDDLIPGYQNSNIANFGISNLKDGYIYYSTQSEKTGNLYRIKEDGTELEVLNDCQATSINIFGEWVYYSNISDEGKLYKTNIKDGNSVILTDTGVGDIYVDKDGIYFKIFENGDMYLAKMDFEKTEINYLEPCYRFVKSGDLIVMLQKGLDTSLYILNIKENTKKEIKMNDIIYSWMHVGEEYLYYMEGSDYSLSRYSILDGTKEKVLSGVEIFNVDEEGIYYFSRDGSIMKSDLDGNNISKIIEEENIFHINILNNGWIYYTKKIAGNASSVHRVKINGSENEAVPEIKEY